MTSKFITRNMKSIEIREEDLRTRSQREVWKDEPNTGTNRAAVTLPFDKWVKNIATGEYTKLYILSANRGEQY